jgi:hypothetical protein
MKLQASELLSNAQQFQKHNDWNASVNAYTEVLHIYRKIVADMDGSTIGTDVYSMLYTCYCQRAECYKQLNQCIEASDVDINEYHHYKKALRYDPYIVDDCNE